MEVRPEIQLKVVLKALPDVILPAIDPANKLAHEQTQLAIGTLQMVAKRLPIAFRYDRDELERYVALSKGLIAEVGATIKSSGMADLEHLATHAADVLDRARAEPVELENAALSLRSAVCELMQEPEVVGNTQVKASMGRLILDASKIELERERALVVDMGFDTDTASLKPIEQQLAPIGKREIR